MGKILRYILPLLLLLGSCNGDLNSRLDRLENDKIASIEQQMEAMSASQSELEAAITLLQGYSASLTATANELRQMLNATNEKIKTIEASADRNNQEIVNLINELNSLKTTTSERLSQLYAAITKIDETILSLDARLTELKAMTEAGLDQMRDWATASFATLRQYNSLLSEVALVQTLASTTSKSFKEFEAKTNEHLATIDTQIAELNEAMYYAVIILMRDVTDAYTRAIAEAEQRITESYTAAIATAVQNVEDGLKEWVGEQFDKYYDIAQTEAKLTALRTTLTDADTALQREIDALATSLTNARTELTTAYESAIAQAIKDNNGVIDTRIAEAISAAEALTEARLDRVESRLDAIEQRIADLEDAVTALLARIQSLTYIPAYSDGRAVVDSATKLVSFDFHISPASCVGALAEVWEQTLSVNAVFTSSRAVTLIPLRITDFEADATQGIVSVTVACDALGEPFFAGEATASAAMFLSDGNNSVISDYIELVLSGR